MMDDGLAKLAAYRRGALHHAKFPVDTTIDPRLQYIAVDGPEHLNLGSGVNPIPGAVNVDVQPFQGVDLTFDFTQPWPLPDTSYDKVSMFHCLEHVTPIAALTLVREAYRVLRWEGVFLAEVPDIVGLCAGLTAGNFGMMTGAIYGGYDAPEDAHRYGYTASSLALLCQLAGFGRLVTKAGTDYHAPQMPTVRVEAVKIVSRSKAAA